MASIDPKQWLANQRNPWVKGNHLNDPIKDKLVNDAIDAFDLVFDKESISPSEIKPIVEAARSRFRHVWEVGADLLVRLAKTHPVAQEAIRDLLKSPKLDDRFPIIAMVGFLDYGLPRAFLLEILKKCLVDKAYRVVEMAAQACDRHYVKELLPELKGSLKTTKHPEAQKTIRSAIAMLKDGYVLEKDEHGILLTVRDKRGWGSLPITQEDIDKGRVPSIVKKMKQNPDYDG